MKLVLLSLLFALAAASPAVAQAPASAPAKPTAKPVGPPSVKTKSAPAAGAPATAANTAEPTDEEIDAKINALTDNMQKNLGLSAAQTEKVRVINRRGVEAIESARLRYRTNPRKLAGVVESISSSRLSAIKDALTPAQFDKYQRKREEKMGIPNVQGVQGTPPPGLGGRGGDQ